MAVAWVFPLIPSEKQVLGINTISPHSPMHVSPPPPLLKSQNQFQFIIRPTVASVFHATETGIALVESQRHVKYSSGLWLCR